ncbi:unnamed protein product [Ixodes pacificus]
MLGGILPTSGDFPCRPPRPHLQRVPRPQPNSTNKDPHKGGRAELLHSRKGSQVCELAGGRLHSRSGSDVQRQGDVQGLVSGSQVPYGPSVAAYIEFSSIPGVLQFTNQKVLEGPIKRGFLRANQKARSTKQIRTFQKQAHTQD